MSSNYKSPFTTAFKSACNRGTPSFVAVNNIAKRNNKNPNKVWESLFKAGCCYRQKFNGQWIYWNVEGGKTKATDFKNCQTQMWQWFIECCISSGCCTPEQMKNSCGSQTVFMNNCKKWFNKQVNGTTTTTTTGRKRSTAVGRKTRTTTVGKRTKTTTGKSFGSRTTTRRYSRAA